MKKYAFGIDVGGTTIKCGLFDLEGNILDKWEIVTNTEDEGSHVLPDIGKTILAKCEEKGIAKEEVQGVGLAVPGPVLENGDVEVAVNLGWGYTKAADILESEIGMHVQIGNDANVAALGECWLGGGKGHKSLVMITLGTGVGGGIIIRHKIFTGAHGAGAEIGHMHVAPEITEPCNCGNCGCLEQVASATGIVRLAHMELAKGGESVLDPETVTAKDVFDAYKAGDAVAAAIVERFGKYLGTSVANLAAALDPEIFIIGGGVSRAGQPLLDVVGKYYKKVAFPVCKKTPIALATLGNDAGICGAARMVIE